MNATFLVYKFLYTKKVDNSPTYPSYIYVCIVLKYKNKILS